LDLFEIEGYPVSALEYLEGITLEERLLAGPPPGLELYEHIGRELAKIHAIEFPEAGFIGPAVRPGKEYGNFSVFLRAFIEKTLKALWTEEGRLDHETNRRTRELVKSRWDCVLATEPKRQLVHSDFNPKNLLVSQNDQDIAILDWEFCLSGNGLLDLGNFFRFAYDYAPEAPLRFEAGYRSVQPGLPANWREIGALLDIGNMCSFLERPEHYPETFRTARAVLKATLESFGA
jgi:Ser/Thr protein kinase RdoA (MazF antagonist)